MTRVGSLTIAQFLDALASPEPTPGGGTAAAMAGAMGGALLVMVAGLAKSRTNTDAEKAALASARDALVPLCERLAGLADADTNAFNEVLAAYRLPKATDEEKAARTRAIQHTLKGATLVPLDTLRACATLMDHAGVVAKCGNRSAASDVGVALGLLEAAAAGAAANVRINLDGIRDESFKTATEAETARLAGAVSANKTAAAAHLAT